MVLQTHAHQVPVIAHTVVQRLQPDEGGLHQVRRRSPDDHSQQPDPEVKKLRVQQCMGAGQSASGGTNKNQQQQQQQQQQQHRPCVVIQPPLGLSTTLSDIKSAVKVSLWLLDVRKGGRGGEKKRVV